MSVRERVLLVLGLIVAAGLVVFPIAYRMSTEGNDAAVAFMSQDPASRAPAAAPPLPTVIVQFDPQVEPTVSLSRVAWMADAVDHRAHDGEMFTYECPPGGQFWPIWGSGMYTDDSSVCTAAVHHGAITRELGGTVSIVIRPAKPSYDSSTQHGVRTESYGPWDGSFEIIDP